MLTLSGEHQTEIFHDTQELFIENLGLEHTREQRISQFINSYSKAYYTYYLGHILSNINVMPIYVCV